MALTKRQKQVLDFIHKFKTDNGYSPSYEEIANGLSLASLATVHKHISALASKQYVERGHNQSRSIDLTTRYFKDCGVSEQRDQDLSVPLLGRIAAGSPVESVAQDQSLHFADFLGRGGTYALEVRGDSMIDDHICSGDYVLVERADDVRDGEIVVALVEGMETTLKRFYREDGDMARLQPANERMEPIRVPLSDVQIQGRVLAVLRKFAK
jgi:repressor LexA